MKKPIILAAKILTSIALSTLTIQKVSAADNEWYVVKKGDSYYNLAQTFGVDINSFDVESALKFGDTISIPEYNLKSCTIKKGDTLYSLANAYSTKIEWIEMANQMDEKSKLLLDSDILIPVKQNVETVSSTVEREVPKVEISNNETPVSTARPSESYVIQSGDTLTSIAQKTNFSIRDLISWNQIKNPNRIFIAQKLLLYGPKQNVQQQKVKSSKEDFQYAEELENLITSSQERYSGMNIGVGIYKISTNEYIFKHNIYSQISSACTVKAAYAMFVLKECQNNNIDIYSEKLKYSDFMTNWGSGIIKTLPVDTQFTINYLLEKLLTISDNTAYNILLSKFPLDDYQKFLNEIDGQNLNDCRYGSCSVSQRVNEWLAINSFCNSESDYGQVLKNCLSNAKYCYIAQGFEEPHNYMHKSGWCDGTSYNSASDACLIDDYIIVILTDDYKSNVAHTDVLRQIGKFCDKTIF